MNITKIGVIGVGYLGRFHALKYAAMENAQLIGVADTDTDRGQEVAKECNCSFFPAYSKLVEKADAVSIVVPTSLHHEVTKKCLEHSVDVMVEKPFTTTLEEADELIALAEEKECILQVGHLERFNPAVIAMEPLLTHPLFIEAHRIATFKGRGIDVDVVLDLMIHDIDIILSIVNSPIKQIHTVGAPVITDLTDIANARLIFENGCTANITVSRISMDNIRRMRIFQPGTYLSVDFGKKEVMSIKLKANQDSEFPVPDIQKHGFSKLDTLELELADFLKHVTNRSRPKVSGLEGRRALDVALQVVEQISINKEHIENLLCIEAAN